MSFNLNIYININEDYSTIYPFIKLLRRIITTIFVYVLYINTINLKLYILNNSPLFNTSIL